VKLLFDQNLSPRLPGLLADQFPDSMHVIDAGLDAEEDPAVWEYAKANGYVIATKDIDFQKRAVLEGPPPKVVWVRLGNCLTDDVRALLALRAGAIDEFAQDPDAAILALL